MSDEELVRYLAEGSKLTIPNPYSIEIIANEACGSRYIMPSLRHLGSIQGLA
jgi:hypothetical protein